MEKELKYRFIMFKLKGHETWRVVDARSKNKELDPKNITAKKVIEIDRLTGVVIVKTISCQ